MELAELEEALDELEQRVERLRALYEQYFMGIEKIEPSVLRKDVDRRFWILRRAQIRNTAMRFKLNTISQRYNTYQQYWQRIIREIEAGTFRRHLIRAEKRFGSEALTIAARKRLGKTKVSEEDKRIEERAKKALEQAEEFYDVDVDFDFEESAARLEPSASPTDASLVEAQQTHQPRPQAYSLEDLDDLESLMGLDAGPTVRGASPQAQGAVTAGMAEPTLPSPPPQAQDGDFGNIGGVFSSPRPPSPPPPPRMRSAIAVPPRLNPPPPPKPAPPAVRPPSPQPALPRPAPSRPTAPMEPPAIADQRVKELYREYVQAKRQCNESTTNITEAALAKSLRGTAEKLKKKHKGRQIDYEVVIKEGRAVLRPVVKN